MIRGPVIIQNILVGGYDLRAHRIHRRILDIPGCTFTLTVILDDKSLAAKLNIRSGRLVKGNSLQFRAVSGKVISNHHQVLRQRQIREAFAVREHRTGARHLRHIPLGNIDAAQGLTAAEHNACIFQACGIPVGDIDRLQLLAILEHVLGILETVHIPVLNTFYRCQASAFHEHIAGIFQLGGIPTGGVYGSQRVFLPAVVHKHFGCILQGSRIPRGILPGAILRGTGIFLQVNTRKGVTIEEHVAHVRYLAHIPGADTDICQRLIGTEHIRHCGSVPRIQQVCIGYRFERRQIAECLGGILIGKDQPIAVTGQDQAGLICTQIRCNGTGRGRIRSVPGCLARNRNMVIREGNRLQLRFVQPHGRVGPEPGISRIQGRHQTPVIIAVMPLIAIHNGLYGAVDGGIHMHRHIERAGIAFPRSRVIRQRQAIRSVTESEGFHIRQVPERQTLDFLHGRRNRDGTSQAGSIKCRDAYGLHGRREANRLHRAETGKCIVTNGSHALNKGQAIRLVLIVGPFCVRLGVKVLHGAGIVVKGKFKFDPVLTGGILVCQITHKGLAILVGDRGGSPTNSHAVIQRLGRIQFCAAELLCEPGSTHSHDHFFKGKVDTPRGLKGRRNVQGQLSCRVTCSFCQGLLGQVKSNGPLVRAHLIGNIVAVNR